ncbi:2-polyprenyl-6-methoxyphenol hydroxylase [Caulobacter zeae]|uniref:2-polyprenyl-6-methoxyphenol hydroxylase n=1 Tax=Caulobacter zeae TaxID=2055137 RepID=A0A2N5D9A0_9CAUL|nr:2-polyprenyl-6-methoxyphenol hydroxylase [Caulobacter zeae]
MQPGKVLIIGGGIAGLTSAIALGKRGFDVEVIEKDPDWTVYGVGIIQQSNVVHAVAELGILDDYLDAGFGYDHVEVYLPDGRMVAKIPSPKLADGYPANVGIGRPALHKVLGDRAKAAGAAIRLGVTAESLDDDGEGVNATFSDGSSGRYDLVIGADGLYSTTRKALFPDAPSPEPTGQSVWRYNFDRPDDVVSLQAYEGPTGVGLVPLSERRMYMYVTTPEPAGKRFEREGLAAAMRERLAKAPPRIAALAGDITDDAEVVYKPLEWLFVEGDWSKGRVVLIGDAVHATTPHLGQGAGMAIEDSLVLAEELAAAETPQAAFAAFEARRKDRCRYIVERSRAICEAQLSKGPPADTATESRKMFEVTAQPI